MKQIIITVITVIFCVSCTQRKAQRNGTTLISGILIDTTTIEYHADTTGPDFVIDTTLERVTMNDTFACFIPDNWSGEVYTAETAFKIAESELKKVKEITSYKPYSINIFDNKIWIIESKLYPPKEDFMFGGVAHIEIEKKNGKILNFVFFK